MKRWQIGLLVVAMVAVATGLYAFAPREGRREVGPEAGTHFGGKAALMAKLGLSKEQMDKMWQLREQLRADTSALRHEVFQKRLEMRTLFANPSAEEATLIAKQKELFSLTQKLKDRLLQFRLEQRRVLTPEQIKKLGEGPWAAGFAGERRGRGFRHERHDRPADRG
jgi:Spy/CpxP family protein refolding chaperone